MPSPNEPLAIRSGAKVEDILFPYLCNATKSNGAASLPISLTATRSMDGDIFACGWDLAGAPEFKGLDSTKDHLVWQWVETTGIGLLNNDNLIFNKHKVIGDRKRNLPFRDSKVIVRARFLVTKFKGSWIN